MGAVHFSTLRKRDDAVAFGFLRARTLRQKRFEQVFESAATPKDSRFYGADAALQDFGDFFVAQSFEIAKDYGAAKDLRDFLKRVLHGCLNFVRRELIERRLREIFNLDGDVAFFGFGIDGDVFLKMALGPSLVVQRFADGDAIEPSFERAALTETANATERLEEDFLGAIGCIGDIAEHAQYKVIDGAVIVGNKPVKGCFGSSL